MNKGINSTSCHDINNWQAKVTNRNMLSASHFLVAFKGHHGKKKLHSTLVETTFFFNVERTFTERKMFSHSNHRLTCRIKYDFFYGKRKSPVLHRGSLEWFIENRAVADGYGNTIPFFPTYLECSNRPAEGTGQHGCFCGPILRRRWQSNEKTENWRRRNDNGKCFLLTPVVGVLVCLNGPVLFI